MNKTQKDAILKYAMDNAVKFNGKANLGAVIGKVFAEFPELRKNAKLVAEEAAKIVSAVNKLGLKKQEEKLELLSPELPEKKHEKPKDIFSHITIRHGDKVVTAFPPEPSKYPHIGHAKALLLNYELARKHNGKFILRFEDTNPELIEEDFYKTHLDNYEWLGVKPDKIDCASEHMEGFYSCAEKLLKKSQAYVCSCPQKKIKEIRFKALECPCRYLLLDNNMKRWKSMFSAVEGEFVLRLKGNMQSPNTTLRDPALLRIVSKEHPRTKKKYSVWPNYDFENAVMDGIEGVTYRLRSKEFELRAELQNLIQTLLGFRQTVFYHFARFNLEGVESSGRKIRELIKKKKLAGWDDPSLSTIVALRRRGFTPKAIKEFVMSTGITKTESVLTWDDLIVHNRRTLDSKCNRYFFVKNPKLIKIKNAPEQDIEIRLHPDFPERGARKFSTKNEFYISDDDYRSLKNGRLYRLMDCLNFKKTKSSFIFDSLEHEKYKDEGDKIIHWLPKQKNLVKAEILMPDREKARGLAEKDTRELEEGAVIQFARFGFCRLDSKNSNLTFWYTHQ